MISGGSIAYYVVVALLSIILFTLCIFLVVIIICRKKSVESEDNLPVKLCAHAYPLADIDTITDGFNHRRIIGKGRLGTVYAATTATGDHLIAVKRIHPRLILSNAGFGFSSIIKSLSLAHHPNVVPIIGFSEAPGERIIVMEFMAMKSLDFHLQQSSNSATFLDWTQRLKIAAGAARGIEYLHEGTAPSIVHGGVKPSNILLDVNFSARVCDYGLSFLAPHEMRGLIGYVDGECLVEKGGVCKENDVYGFGVVLLELLSGRSGEIGMLVEWALPLIRDMRIVEILDPRILVPSDMKPIVRLAKLASACVSNTRKNRPSIVQVATILNSLEMELSLDLNISSSSSG
ncbi:Protein kinase domain [Macleaya cordata]|uniref:Protein kinase domain n=1 Tax=Macleaya cordata TaxID=56857 RepID=A0A200QKV2_MACCD|nr:Protein kinase domain [Macleaya cordata]